MLRDGIVSSRQNCSGVTSGGSNGDDLGGLSPVQSDELGRSHSDREEDSGELHCCVRGMCEKLLVDTDENGIQWGLYIYRTGVL